MENVSMYKVSDLEFPSPIPRNVMHLGNLELLTGALTALVNKFDLERQENRRSRRAVAP